MRCAYLLRLTSVAAYLKGRLHGSYSGLRDFFQDVVGVRVSRGYVAKLLRKAAQAFGPPHGELIELLRKQPLVNCDETGHKERAQRYWIWCFRAVNFVVFKIVGGGVKLVENGRFEIPVA